MDRLSPQKTLGIALTPAPFLSPSLPPSPTPTPLAINSCQNMPFIEEQWNVTQYVKDSENYYLPKSQARNNFLFPPIPYNEKIPADFKKIDIVYEATFQNKQSTSSATLSVALYDDNKNVVFSFEIPQPNRQLIGRKIMGDGGATDLQVTPKVIPPLTLQRKIPYFGTNEIIITPLNSFQNEITYVLSGYYLDQDSKPQPIYIETPVTLKTVNPSVREFTFVIGTGRQGRLKVKTFSICYK